MVLDSAIATGALVRREMLTTMRQGRTWALVTCAVALTFGVTAFVLATVGEGGLSVPEAQQLFGIFAMMLFGAAIILVPLYASTLVCQEKQEDTYDGLLTSLIPPWGIVSGKIVTALSYYFFIVVATMPLLGVFFFFAGVDQAQFRQAFLLLLLSALGSGAIGVACSAIFYRSAAAILLTVITVAAFQGGVVLSVILSAELLFGYRGIPQPIRDLGDIVPVWSPVGALYQVIEGSIRQDHFLYNILYQFLAIALAYAAAFYFLRRPARPMRVQHERPIDDQAVLRDRRKTFPYYLVDPLRRAQSIPDDRNPMYYKELLSGFLGGNATRVRIFYVYLVLGMTALSIPFAFNYSGDNALLVGMALLLQTVVIALAVPVVVASVFTKEFESGGLDMLRMTMLRTAPVVLGKLFAVAITIAPMVLAMWVLAIPALLFTMPNMDVFVTLIAGLISMLVTIAYATGISAIATLFTRRMGAAIIASYLACFMILGGLPALAMFISDRLFGSAFSGGGSDLPIAASATLSPITANLYHAFTLEYGDVNLLMVLYLAVFLGFYARLAWVLNRIALGLFAREGMQERIQS